jgi:muramoyltetrapeptide carboxypeptidase
MPLVNRSVRFLLMWGPATVGWWLGWFVTLGMAQDWIRPPALKPGDTVAIVAPAGPLAEVEPLRELQRVWEKAGYRVLIPDRLLAAQENPVQGNPDQEIPTQFPQPASFQPSYLSGSDEERAAELNAAIRNPDVRAILAARGGYGLSRILDQLDYGALEDDPKIIAGYSDLTALHLAIAKQVRLVTFHSPNANELSRFDGGAHDFSRQIFQQTVFANQSPLAADIPLPINIPPQWKIEGLNSGRAQGRLVGGNLSLICATLGTPYAIDPENAILFLEDVGESAYRVDRMLAQLRLAGLLDQVAGVVVGQFTVTDPAEAIRIERVMREYLQHVAVPVLLNFPAGHRPYNVTLPHGVMVEIDATGGELKLLELPVVK